MSTAVITKPVAETSPHFHAPNVATRTAGALYFLSTLTAIAGEVYLQGSLSFAAGMLAIFGYVAVALLSYEIFKPVNTGLATLAAFFSLIGGGFETMRLNPAGVDIAVVFHGVFCLIVGNLAFKSSFLPRMLGALMMIAGFGWLTFLSPSLAGHISPFNLAIGFVGEGSLMLWLLVAGVNVQRWGELAGVVR